MAEAIYIQIDGPKHAERLAQQYVPKPVQTFIANWGIYGQLLVEKRVEFRWTF